MDDVREIISSIKCTYERECMTVGELMEILAHPIDGAENCRECLAFFGATETGHAARAVAEWIVRQLDDK